MPDVFISYSSRDRDRVSRLAGALGAKGFNVWWDSAGLNAGDSWRKEIEHHLRAAKVVIVCWSHSANDSRWVLQEAEEAVRARRLIPVLIEDVEPPFGFRETQALDLVPWLVGRDQATFNRLLVAIDRVNGAPARVDPAPPPPPRPRVQRAPIAPPSEPAKNKLSPAALVIAAVVALALGGWAVNKFGASQSETTPSEQHQAAGNTEPPLEAAPVVQAPPEPVVQTPQYPVCDPAYSLECLNPLVRRAVEEARRNATEADDVRARATVAQAAGQEAARRARQGLSGFEVQAASNSQREAVALFEGMGIGSVFSGPRSKYATLRYQPSDGRDRYEGEWSYANGVSGRAPVGVGAMTFRTGDIYYGTFVDGRRNGMGVMAYTNGATSSGLWVNDNLSSFVMRSPDGARLSEGSLDYQVHWTSEGQISTQTGQ